MPDAESSEEDCYTVFRIRAAQKGHQSEAPYVVELACQGQPVEMEVGIGASCIVMSQQVSESLQNNTASPIKLQPNHKLVRTYTKEPIKTSGMLGGDFT